MSGFLAAGRVWDLALGNKPGVGRDTTFPTRLSALSPTFLQKKPFKGISWFWLKQFLLGASHWRGGPGNSCASCTVLYGYSQEVCFQNAERSVTRWPQP